MAHRLDSPIAREDIRLDITDLYVFRGETGTVFVINVCHSIAGQVPAPGYHPEGMYEFKIDLDGDAVEDVTYRLTFDERDAAGKQRFVLRCIRGAEAVDPNAAGTLLAQGTTGESVTRLAVCECGPERRATRSGSSRTCCTPSATRSRTVRPSTSADGCGTAKNGFAGHTVYSIVLEIPDGELWSTPATSGGSESGPWRAWPPTPGAGARSIASGCR